ncbi:hypothetical protein ACQ856_28765 (plasmid) [Mycolicibacterium psychrotolerans]|uniref:hypothetical protein n=1 Tax=Mycolicibacterium psychrotolerans TaxID=216929 RepID=UPI003D671E36
MLVEHRRDVRGAVDGHHRDQLVTDRAQPDVGVGVPQPVIGGGGRRRHLPAAQRPHHQPPSATPRQVTSSATTAITQSVNAIHCPAVTGT